MFCENCGKELESGAQFCTECGSSVEAAPLDEAKKLDEAAAGAFCVSCGTALRPDACFCEACGARVEKPEPELPVIGPTQSVASAQGASGDANRALADDKNGLAVAIGIAAGVIVAAIVFALFICAYNPFGQTDSSQTAQSGQTVEQNQGSKDDAAEGSAEVAGQSESDGEPYETGQSSSIAPDEDIETPFWAAFVFASRSYDNAQRMADDMTDKGFESVVLDTTEWENLNAEPWYSVSVGMWEDESDARKMASKLRKKGYSDAYAKYTGEYADGVDVVKLSVKTKKGKAICGMVHRDDGEYVIADSSEREYSESELKSLGLTDAELCVAWNEPFARLGYHFDNSGLREYFESCDWYTDEHKKFNLSGVSAANNSNLRKIAGKKSSSKRWMSLEEK